MRRVNGNKILLTRLFLLPSYCFHLISDSRFALLNGLRLKFTLMRRGRAGEEGGEKKKKREAERRCGVHSPTWIKRSRLSRLSICPQRTHWVIHRHIRTHHKENGHHGPFGWAWKHEKVSQGVCFENLSSGVQVERDLRKAKLSLWHFKSSLVVHVKKAIYHIDICTKRAMLRSRHMFITRLSHRGWRGWWLSYRRRNGPCCRGTTASQHL